MQNKLGGRLEAYIKLRFMYCRNLLQMDTGCLHKDMEDRQTDLMELDLLSRRILDRLDEIRVVLGNDNIHRNRAGRDTYSLL